MVGFVCADFDQRKARVLDDLRTNSNDLSPKGSVDAPIAPLIALINSSPDFYTTSCCSGRIALFLHTQPNQPKTGRWLLVDHHQVDWTRVKEAVEAGMKGGGDGGEESVGVLKFEPFILSIACRSLSSASALLAAAVQSGCRESGIGGLHLPGEGSDESDAGSSALPRPVMVSVRCSIRLEVPVLYHGRCVVSEDFLRLLVQQVNGKLTRNWQRMSSFEAHFSRAFLSDAPHSLRTPPITAASELDDALEERPSDVAEPSQPPAILSSHPPPSLASRLASLHSSMDALDAALLAVHSTAVPQPPHSTAVVDPPLPSPSVDDAASDRCWAVLVPRSQAMAVREACRAKDYNQRKRRVKAVDGHLVDMLTQLVDEAASTDAAPVDSARAEDDCVALPITDAASTQFHRLLAHPNGQQRLRAHLQLPSSPPSAPVRSFPLLLHLARCPLIAAPSNPHQELSRAVRTFCQERGVRLSSSLLSSLPQRWEHLGDLVLLPPDAFTSPAWAAALSSLSTSELSFFYSAIASSLRCRRLARQQPIQAGLKRQSAVQLLFGDDGRVEHRENGVLFAFDVRLCMFSSGNATEKQRMIDAVQRALTIIPAGARTSPYVVADLYTGIGYFSLPILVHTSVAHVHCCELNDDAVAALQASLARNRIDPSRYSLHPGDNRRPELRRTLRGVANRVLLGLLPSSEDGYALGLTALKDEGGVLHIHGNAPADRKGGWVEGVVARLSSLLRDGQEVSRRRWTVRVEHVERVKSFAPFIDHLVLDVHLLPPPPDALISTLSLPPPATSLPAPSPPLAPSPFSYPNGVAEYQAPSVSTFWDAIYPRGEPCVLTGLDVGVLDAFTPQALSALPPSSCPDVVVHVCPEPSGRMDFTTKSSYTLRTMPFHDFIQRLLVSSTSASPASSNPSSPPPSSLRDAYFVSPCERLYLRSLGSDPRCEVADFFSSFPVLAQHFRIPDLLHTTTPHSSVFRVSSPGLSLWNHFDSVSNLLVHLHGVKRVTLFPPSSCSDLHLPPVPHSSSSPVVDLYTPDLHRFPRFPAAQRAACQLLLHPGSVLLIPALWFHHVETVGSEVGVSVNIFWKGLSEELYSAKDVYGNRDLKAGVACMTRAQEGIKEVAHLPPVYQDFYIRRAQSVLDDAIAHVRSV